MELRPDVVAGKFDPSLFDPTGARLLVNEIFYSIQGEGYHAGRATLFIRLAKCNLKCSFCDTEFEQGEMQTVADIVDTALGMVGSDAKSYVLVDITGGEPLLQNCGPLVQELRRVGFFVGCETSGSVWTDWVERLDWVTCSPKVPLARMDPRLLPHIDELKWVVNDGFMSGFTRDPSNFYVPHKYNFLQPESNLPKWMTVASNIIRTDPRYRLSLQTHKIVGVR